MVEECFVQFAINIDDSKPESIDRTDIIEKQIKSINSKIKKLYDLYIERQSDNLLDMINSEEEKVRDLELEIIAERNDSNDGLSEEKISQIKHMADIWDVLKIQEKNKILKQCIDKIVIMNGNVEIHFHTI